MLIPEAERKLSIARKVQAEKEKRLREKEALIAKKKREKKQRRIAKMTQEFDQFRKNIKQGDDSHCGLVVKVDGAVVLVQSMIGPHWLKLDEIYPANRARCGFSNGVYVHNDPRWY